MKELYTRGYIKSKSLDITSSLSSLVNKIMYICKSNINKIIKDDNLNDDIVKISFSKNTFSVHYLTTELYQRNIYLNGVVKEAQNNTTEFDNRVFIINKYVSSFSFVMAPLGNAFSNGNFSRYNGNIYNEDYDLKETLDIIINGITSINVKFKWICSHFENAKLFNNDYSFSLEDIYFIINGLGFRKKEFSDLSLILSQIREAGHSEELRRARLPISNNDFILNFNKQLYSKIEGDDLVKYNSIIDIATKLKDRLGVIVNNV